MKRVWKTGLGCLLCAAVLVTAATVGMLPRSGGTAQVDWSAFWREFWREHDRVTWVTVGDSITSGDMRYTQGYRQYYEWMQARLNGELGKHVTVVNPATGGLHLYQFAERCGAWVDPYAPEIVTVFFGMNDGNADAGRVEAGFEELVGQLVPTPENVAAGVPEDRVVVLAACQPMKGPEEMEGRLRRVHAYGAQLSRRWCEAGYKVQYVDLYDYFKNRLPYGADGYLAGFADYADPGSEAHLGPAGHYAAAQELMRAMGLYDGESALCNMPHDELFTQAEAPALALDYGLARRGMEGAEELPAAWSEGFSALAAGEESGTLLILGGAATSGVELTPPEYRSWPELVTAYLRCELGRTECRVATVAAGDYGPAWFQAHLGELMERYERPRAVLYMPEVAAVYEEGYTHTEEAVGAFREALDGFLEACAAMGTDVTLLTPFPVLNGARNAALGAYVSVILECAEARGAAVCNIYGVLNQALERDPMAAQHWYTGGGRPGHIAQSECAQTFLRAAAGYGAGRIFGYGYREGGE